MMRWASILLRIALAAVWGTAALAAAGQVHQIIQKDRAFSMGDIAIAAGDSLAFLNQDKFLHQIYVASGGLKFDSAEQAPGEVITIAFPDAGAYEIRCHIHPKMSLKVTVQ